jgi:hypothetical protein
MALPNYFPAMENSQIGNEIFVETRLYGNKGETHSAPDLARSSTAPL